jgi:hypothetical protein
LSSSCFWTSTSAYERPTLPPDHDRSTSLSLVTRLRLHRVGSTAFGRPTDFPPRTTTFRFYLTSSERATSAVLTPSTVLLFAAILRPAYLCDSIFRRAYVFGLDSVARTLFAAILRRVYLFGSVLTPSTVPISAATDVQRTFCDFDLTSSAHFSALTPSAVLFSLRSYVQRTFCDWILRRAYLLGLDSVDRTFFSDRS